MADHDEIISQFTNMTGCDAERANFYLESHNWDIGPALETYFDSSAGADADDPMDVEGANMGIGPQRPVIPAQNPYPPTAAQRIGAPGTNAPINFAKPTNPPSSGARIATFSSIRKPESDEGSEGEHDDEQEFYVGSGQEVIGPGKKRNPDEIIASVFKSAREHGAEQIEDPAQDIRPNQPRSFGGSGMRLGDSSTNNASPSTTNVSTVGPAAVPGAAEDYNPIVTLRMWRNGFTVNDGILRPYSDPINQQFMASIKQGRVPTELIMAARGRELKLQMEDKRDQDFQSPKRPAEYFGGTGHMLGSPAPAVIAKPTAVPQSEAAKKEAEERAKGAFVTDSAQPATNIQIRLPDGSRLINRFNEVHTVADVRRFIQLARPEFAAQDFQMLAGFPLKPLSNEKASLKDANLLNAAINVK